MIRDILDSLAAYLQGDTSLEAFHGWLVQQTWDNANAPAVAHQIEFLIEEAASGTYTLPQLRDELTALTAVYKGKKHPRRAHVVTSSRPRDEIAALRAL